MRVHFIAILASLLMIGIGARCLHAQILFKTDRYYFGADRYKRFNRGFDLGELEVTTPRFLLRRIDLAFQLGGTTMQTIGEVDLVSGPDPLQFRTVPAFARRVFRVTAGARFFPVGTRVITPFTGIGLGYYQYYTSSTTAGAPRTCPPSTLLLGYDCFEVKENSKTLASGLGKFVTAGVYIPLSPSWGNTHKVRLVASGEFRYHFAALDRSKGMDLSGQQVLIGLGIAWQ